MGRKPAWSFSGLMSNIDKIRVHTFKKNNKKISACIAKMIEVKNSYKRLTPKQFKVTRQMFDDFTQLVEGDDRQWLMETLKNHRYEEKRKRISVNVEIAERLKECYSKAGDEYYDLSDFIEHLLDLYEKKDR